MLKYRQKGVFSLGAIMIKKVILCVLLLLITGCAGQKEAIEPSSSTVSEPPTTSKPLANESFIELFADETYSQKIIYTLPKKPTIKISIDDLDISQKRRDLCGDRFEADKEEYLLYAADIKNAVLKALESVQGIAEPQDESDELFALELRKDADVMTLRIRKDKTVKIYLDGNNYYQLSDEDYADIRDAFDSFAFWYDSKSVGPCWLKLNTAEPIKYLSERPSPDEFDDYFSFNTIDLDLVKSVSINYDRMYASGSDLTFKSKEAIAEYFDYFYSVSMENIKTDIYDIIQPGAPGPSSITIDITLTSDYHIVIKDVYSTGAYVSFVDDQGNEYYKGNFIGEADKPYVALKYDLLTEHLGYDKYELRALHYEDEDIIINTPENESFPPVIETEEHMERLKDMKIYVDGKEVSDIKPSPNKDQVIILEDEAGNRFEACY